MGKLIMSKKYKMKTPKFIKLTANHEGELLKLTLNTSNIDSYFAHESRTKFDTKCRISISSHKDTGCDMIYVMETKEYLDNLLT